LGEVWQGQICRVGDEIRDELRRRRGVLLRRRRGVLAASDRSLLPDRTADCAKHHDGADGDEPGQQDEDDADRAVQQDRLADPVPRAV
jgi:hypothetical protein